MSSKYQHPPAPHNFKKGPDKDRVEIVTGLPKVHRSGESGPVEPPRSFAPPDGCVDSCLECTTQFQPLEDQKIPALAYSEEITNATAKIELKCMVYGMQEDCEFLQAKIAGQGNTIVKRWKKSEAERRAILLEAVPDIYPARWPLLHLRDEDLPIKLIRKLRKAFLLPYIDLKTLAHDSMKLLCLVHFRTAFTPEDWVMFDSRQIENSKVKGALEIQYNPNCTALHHWGLHYGKLVRWDKRNAHSWNHVGYPMARLILEAQHLLLAFLRKTVEILTKDVAPNGQLPLSTFPLTPSKKWRDMAADGFKSVEYWSAYSNLAFSCPPRFDPELTLATIDARLAEADNDIWLL